ncbi:TIGR03084 family metal-binding protein [Nocardia sp. NPDC004860]|uniref:TIGR03084 family metal-binding protein n=1 Tax=Nocardia sp. NPDC004860 TaxID=3154557 RepID=UPI0033A63960
MGLDYPALLRDLERESDRLIDCLYSAAESDWEAPTPAAGWAVRDQISHLAFFDDFAHLAMTNANLFRVEAAELTSLGPDFPDRAAERYRHLTRCDLLNWFTESRQRLLSQFTTDDPKRRLPWFGPDMSVASSATARLMETWAHGRDVYDTLGVVAPPSPGLRSIAHLGVSTFAFAHRLRGLQVPAEPVHVTLNAPDRDEVWTWGPADADNRISGPAEDFVLVVTQRRHPDDTELTIQGDVASAWMAIAQAYAGEPGPGRPSRTATARREFDR